MIARFLHLRTARRAVILAARQVEARMPLAYDSTDLAALRRAVRHLRELEERS